MEQIKAFILEQLQNNDFAAGALFAGALTAMWQIARGWPAALWARLSRLIFYSVTIEESDELYHLLNKWLSKNYPDKLRIVEAKLKDKLSRHDDDTEVLRSEVNYFHYSDFVYAWRKLRLIRISKSREKLENAQSFSQAYMGRFTISGLFTKNVIKEVLEECLDFLPERNKNILRKNVFHGYSWFREYEENAKTLDGLFIPQKEELVNDLDLFLSRRDWYKDRSLKYKRTYLFHGHPGSGKSSLASALAMHSMRDLYILNLATCTDTKFAEAMGSLNNNSILLLDDVDIGMPKRDDTGKTLQQLNLSTVLSYLDGPLSKNDIIIVMTTNDLSKFDKALLRKGRVDVAMEISFPDKVCVQNYLEKFFDAPVVLPEEAEYNCPMSDIQEICIRATDVNEAITNILKKTC